MNKTIRLCLLAALAVAAYSTQAEASGSVAALRNRYKSALGNNGAYSLGGAATASASVGPAGASSAAAAGSYYQKAGAAPPAATVYARQPQPSARRAPVVQRPQYHEQEEVAPQYHMPRQQYRQPAPVSRYQQTVPAYHYQQAEPEPYPQVAAAAATGYYQPQSQHVYRKPARKVAREQPQQHQQPFAHYAQAEQDHYQVPYTGAYAYAGEQDMYANQHPYNDYHEQQQQQQQLPQQHQHQQQQFNVQANRGPSAGNHRSRAAASASASVNGGHGGSSSAAAAAVETADGHSAAYGQAYAPTESYDNSLEQEEYDESYDEPDTVDHYESRDGTYGATGNGLETGSYLRSTESEENHEDGHEDGDSYYNAHNYNKANDVSQFMNYNDDDEDIMHTPSMYHKKKRNTNITSNYNKAQRETGSGVLAHDKFSAAYNKNSKKLKENVDQRYSKATDGAVETQSAQSAAHIDEEDEKKTDSRGLGTFKGVNGEVHQRRQVNSPAAVAAAAASASFKKSS